jgi:hypothetical protein
MLSGFIGGWEEALGPADPPNSLLTAAVVCPLEEAFRWLARVPLARPDAPA